MSRLDPSQNKPINPAKKFFEWSGKDGELTYYDKEAVRPDVAKIDAEIAEMEASLATTPAVAKQAVTDIINDLKKKRESHNIPVKMPFTFIALDRLVTLGGYNKSAGVGYYANEIKKDDLKTAPFQVRSKNGLEAEGLYDHIKGKLSGLKYVEVVYVAFMEGGEFHIGAIRMSGSSLTSWFNYVNGEVDANKKRISDPHDPYKGAIVLSKGPEAINGETRYYPPAFQAKEIKPETDAKAMELAKVLSEYHTAYFNYTFKKAVETTVAQEESAEVAEAFKDVPFTAAAPATPSAKEIAMAKQKELNAQNESGEDDFPWDDELF